MATWTEHFMRGESEPTHPGHELCTFYFRNQFQELCKESSPVGTDGKIQQGSRKKRKRRKKRTLTGVSRQRRAANDRERRRNQRLNQAFVNLKNILPLPCIDISKIQILRLAVKWIDHLGTLLKDYEQQKDLLNMKQMETSRLNKCSNTTREDYKSVKHDCLYHQLPDLKNTLWEESIGLPGRCKSYCVSLMSFLDTERLELDSSETAKIFLFLNLNLNSFVKISTAMTTKTNSVYHWAWLHSNLLCWKIVIRIFAEIYHTVFQIRIIE